MAIRGPTYWLTFGIANDGHFAWYHDRLKRAIAAAAIGQVWDEPTSFCMFRSSLPIDRLADQLASAIRIDRDFLLVGTAIGKEARLRGYWTDDRVRQLMPFAELG